MKHIKTFEQHDSSIEEGLFWDSAKEKFEKAYNTFVSVWTKKGASITTEEKAEIFKQAAADKYEGRMGLTKGNKGFYYRDSKGVVWGSEFAGGGTGGHGTGVSK